MKKYMQRCDATGKGMNEGFVVGDGEMYFSTEVHLIEHLRQLNWQDSNGKQSKDIDDDTELMNFFYNEDYYYYTEWDETDIDDCYYDAEGNEFNN